MIPFGNQQPELPFYQPQTFEEAVTELDAANMQLYSAAARYADFPLSQRFEVVTHRQERVTHTMYYTLVFGISESASTTDASGLCAGILATDNLWRKEAFQEILSGRSFSLPSPKLETIMSQLAQDETENDDTTLLNTASFLHQQSLAHAIDRFHRYADYSGRGHTARATEYAARLANESAKLGIAAGIGALMLRSLRSRPRLA